MQNMVNYLNAEQDLVRKEVGQQYLELTDQLNEKEELLGTKAYKETKINETKDKMNDFLSARIGGQNVNAMWHIASKVLKPKNQTRDSLTKEIAILKQKRDACLIINDSNIYSKLLRLLGTKYTYLDVVTTIGVSNSVHYPNSITVMGKDLMTEMVLEVIWGDEENSDFELGTTALNTGEPLTVGVHIPTYVFAKSYPQFKLDSNDILTDYDGVNPSLETLEQTLAAIDNSSYVKYVTGLRTDIEMIKAILQ